MYDWVRCYCVHDVLWRQPHRLPRAGQHGYVRGHVRGQACNCNQAREDTLKVAECPSNPPAHRWVYRGKPTRGNVLLVVMIPQPERQTSSAR